MYAVAKRSWFSKGSLSRSTSCQNQLTAPREIRFRETIMILSRITDVTCTVISSFQSSFTFDTCLRTVPDLLKGLLYDVSINDFDTYFIRNHEFESVVSLFLFFDYEIRSLTYCRCTFTWQTKGDDDEKVILWSNGRLSRIKNILFCS